MTVVTVRPDATTFNYLDAITAVGAASLHAALADDSDASYATDTVDPNTAEVAFAEPVLPSGAVLKRLALRARVSNPAGGALQVFFRVREQLFAIIESYVAVSWSSPTTVTVGSYDGNSAAELRCGIGGTGSTAGIRVTELYIDATYVAQPVGDVTAPSGTVADTNVPSVQWTDTLDSDGGAQTFYEVKLFTVAQYGAGGFDPATTSPYATSGITAGAAVSWQDTVILPDGDYRAYVRVAQTVNGTAHWSAWDFSAFTIDVALPAIPTLTVTPDDDTGSIELLATHNAGTATTDAVEVQRSIDAGSTWEPVRLTTDTDGVITATDAMVVDFEAPNGTTVQYRARALHDYSGVYAASDWATGSGTWSSMDWWLKCPEVPALNAIVKPYSFASRQRAARQGAFQPLGAQFPVVVTDTRGGWAGSLQLQVDDQAAQADVDALLDSLATLLLQGPPTHDEPDRYLRFGDQDRARWIDKAFARTRIDTLAWTEVAAPTGVITGWPPVVLPSDTLLPSTTLYPS